MPEGFGVGISDGVGTIRLNRQSVLNALDEAMIDDLRRVLAELADDESCAVLVLAAEGRAFCAGMNLRDERLTDELVPVDLGIRMIGHYNPLIRDILAFPKATISAVNGVAAGGGASLALACDVCVAADESSFIQVFAGIGLVPDLGATWLLPHSAGLARARGMALMGEPVSAPLAEQWGLIWKSVPSAELEKEVASVAQKLRSLPPATIVATRQLMAESFEQDVGAQLNREMEFQRSLGFSEAFRTRVRDFVAKRKKR